LADQHDEFLASGDAGIEQVERTRCAGLAAPLQLLNGSLLSERMWIVTFLPLETGVSDGYDEPSSPAHD